MLFTKAAPHCTDPYTFAYAPLFFTAWEVPRAFPSWPSNVQSFNQISFNTNIIRTIRTMHNASPERIYSTQKSIGLIVNYIIQSPHHSSKSDESSLLSKECKTFSRFNGWMEVRQRIGVLISCCVILEDAREWHLWWPSRISCKYFKNKNVHKLPYMQVA